MDGYVATVLEMDGHRLARVRMAKGTLEVLKEADNDARESEAGDAEGVGAAVVHLSLEKEPGKEGEESGRQVTVAQIDADDCSAREARGPIRDSLEVDHVMDRKSEETPSDREQVDCNGENSRRHSGERG